MSNQIFHVLLGSLKKFCLAILRILLFSIGWCIKTLSRIIEKIGDEILKLSEK